MSACGTEQKQRFFADFCLTPTLCLGQAIRLPRYVWVKQSPTETVLFEVLKIYRSSYLDTPSAIWKNSFIITCEPSNISRIINLDLIAAMVVGDMNFKFYIIMWAVLTLQMGSG